MENLQKRRDELEALLKRKEEAHHKKPHWGSEGSYQDSVLEIRNVYNELSKVAQELGDPVPVWF